jgi:type II secretory pathway component PulF
MIERGEQPGPHLASTGCFPPEFVGLYRSGETSGQLEQNLFRLTDTYQQRAHQALTIATIVYPAALLCAVLGFVAYQAVTFYAGYLKMLTDLTSG